MGTLVKIHQYRNNFSVKRSTKVVYTSLERHLYGRNDRAKFFIKNQILRGLGTNIRIWAHQPKNTDIVITLA